MTVEEVMTKEVVTVSPDTTIAEVSRLISETGHLAFPVVTDSKLLGIVSLKDTMKVLRNKVKETRVEPKT